MVLALLYNTSPGLVNVCYGLFQELKLIFYLLINVRKESFPAAVTTGKFKPSFFSQDAAASTTHGVLVTYVVQSANLRQLPFESIFHEPT